MRKSIIILTLLVGIITLTNAQIKGVSSFIFKPYWHLNASQGFNSLIAEGYNEYSFFESLGSTSQISLGYFLTPAIGLSATVGYTTHNWPEIRMVDTSFAFEAQNLCFELNSNLSNLFKRYDLNRKTDLFVNFGVGVIHRNKDLFLEDQISAFGKLGLKVNFRITQFLDWHLIAESTLLNDNYNNNIDGLPIEIYNSLLVGISYNFRTNKAWHKYSRK